MSDFAAIQQIAAGRKGGPEALEALLATPLTPAALAAVPDHRWLSAMTKTVFQAGFNWSVIEKKWEGFETAFDGFEPRRWAMMGDDDLDRLLADKRIVRNGAKIRSVRDNAALLVDLAEAHGSAARFFAEWPADDYVGLITFLKKRASRLGGSTAQYFLRWMGVDGFILSRDVVAALIREGVVDREPSSQRDLQSVQAAFNRWRAESGRSLTAMSKILACSVGERPATAEA